MPLHTTHCSPLPPIPAHLHWQPFIPCAGSEPAPRWIKNSPRKRTRMTQIKRIFTDFPNRVNPRHPCNPCSTSASLFVDAPDSNGSNGINSMDRIKPSANPVNPVSPVQSGSSFSAAPDINRSEFIKSYNSISQSPEGKIWYPV
jgi:hypothetical protein